MLRPFQAESTETLWCFLCCVVLELCRRTNLSGFGGAATRRLPASQGGAHPFNEAEPEVTPPPSSAEYAMVPDYNGDPVDLNPVPTYNEASVINSDGIVYDPFDRPPGEEPGPVALVGRDSPDRRLCKCARRCLLMLFSRLELLTCAHACMLVWLRAGEASTSFSCPERVFMSVTRSLSQESHATSTLASNWSDWSSVQGPTEETLARGSSDCPCRAIRLVKFPRDGQAPSDTASGSDAFPPKSNAAARSGIEGHGSARKKEMCCCSRISRSIWILNAYSLPGGPIHSGCATV